MSGVLYTSRNKRPVKSTGRNIQILFLPRFIKTMKETQVHANSRLVAKLFAQKCFSIKGNPY